MNTDYSIEVNGLGKRYRLGVIGRETLTEELSYRIATFLGREPGGKSECPNAQIPDRLAPQRDSENPDQFWSLRDISFTVESGEIIAIIGDNGAGKSTLLKILSRITEPTEGRVRISGRLSSLLEVGTGFHPELTGKENVFLNGAILGMQEDEIHRKFDDIVAFSELEEFINTPVKRYSSGMRTRLAFSVAAFLEPDVLLLDEVLSVGDASFQRKCKMKMDELAGHGRTVLIVSHNISTLVQMCSRTLWIDHGKLRMDGPTQDVVSAYVRTLRETEAELTSEEGFRPGHFPDLALYALRMRNKDGKLVDVAVENEPLSFEIEFEWTSECPPPSMGIEVMTENAVTLFESFSPESIVPQPGSRHCFQAGLPVEHLQPGTLLVRPLARLSHDVPGIRMAKPLRVEILPAPGRSDQKGPIKLHVDWQDISSRESQ